jgi:hypothetical protein
MTNSRGQNSRFLHLAEGVSFILRLVQEYGSEQEVRTRMEMGAGAGASAEGSEGRM